MTPRAVLVLLCVAEVLSMTGFATWPAVLPLARAEWGLGEASTGVVSGALFFGYLLAVPLLVPLTDAADARFVYAGSCLLACAGCLGFGFAASGTWGASACQALVGAGLSGTYMPGLKALTDRVPPPARSRLLAWYTSTFGVGSAVSLLLAGACATRLGWRAAFLAASGGPLLAMVLVLWKLGPVPSAVKPGARLLSDVGTVLRNRPVVGWVIGYACHCWELFGLRSWIVAFLLPSCGGDVARAAAAAALLQLLGPAASIVGNETSLRLGRRSVVLFAMIGSGVLASVLGATFSASWPIVLSAAACHYLFVMLDSAALTAGVVAACDDARRGTTLAVHSFAGFASGCVAPIVFGAALQSLGGSAVPRAWLLAFATLSAASLAGALALARWTSRSA